MELDELRGGLSTLGIFYLHERRPLFRESAGQSFYGVAVRLVKASYPSMMNAE
jgi:hypothetical protein